MMSLNKRGVALWSDLDGTAVTKLPMYRYHNMTKTKLPLRMGYGEFLLGAKSRGLSLDGLVSRRPDIKQRRKATNSTLSEHGLEGLFKEVILAGSEDRKGLVLAERAQLGRLALIDDKPHRIGPAILKGFREVAARQVDEEADIPGTVYRPTIVLGVVNHSKSLDYTERFTRTTPLTGSLHIRYTQGATLFCGENFTLGVVTLQEYGYEAGIEFADIATNIKEY